MVDAMGKVMMNLKNYIVHIFLNMMKKKIKVFVILQMKEEYFLWIF